MNKSVTMATFVGLFVIGLISQVFAADNKPSGGGTTVNQPKIANPPARINATKPPVNPIGGGAVAQFTCGVLTCQCKGDQDCNKMFSSGACGGKGQCDNGTGECACFRAP